MSSVIGPGSQVGEICLIIGFQSIGSRGEHVILLSFKNELPNFEMNSSVKINNFFNCKRRIG